MKLNRAFRNETLSLSFILGLFGLAIVLVNPLGNFPSVDDWAYAHSVELFVTSGILKIHTWTSSNILSQILWDAGFALPFGTSLTVLRFSTLAAAGSMIRARPANRNCRSKT